MKTLKPRCPPKIRGQLIWCKKGQKNAHFQWFFLQQPYQVSADFYPNEVFFLYGMFAFFDSLGGVVFGVSFGFFPEF